MKRFITIVVALLAISLLVSCGNLSLAGKNVNLPNNTGKGTIRIRVGDAVSVNARAVDIPTQRDVTKYEIVIYKSEGQEVVFTDYDITPEEMALGIATELPFDTYSASVNAWRDDEIIFRGVSQPVVVTAVNTEENPAIVTVQMYQILAVYDNGTVSTDCYWERLMTDEDAEHLNWFIPSVDDVDNDSWKISGKEVIGWKNTDTDLEYDAGDKIWLSDKTLPLHLEAIWAEPDTAEPIKKLIEFFTHDGTFLRVEQYSNAITSEELAEDGTFELPIEDLTENMEWWGLEYLPEGATFDGWKDAAGNTWTLSETMSVEDLPDELPLKLYAQWDLPARVSYWFNYNWYEGYDNSEEFTEREGAVISLDDILDYFGFYYPVYIEQAFIGCSVNKQFPVIDSSNYDEIIAELKNTVVLKDGDSYVLTDDTTFYVIWADYYSLSNANKIVKVKYRLGEAEDQITEDAQKTHYYLKDLMESYNDIENNTYYILPLPDVNEIFPQWDNAPVGTIKDDKWIYHNDRENPVSGEIDLTETDFYDWNCDIDIWSEIKVPIIQYWDGGTYYGGTEYSTDTINQDRMENFVYYKSWPFPDSFDFDVWKPSIADYENTLFASSLSHDYSALWEFEKWKDKNTGYAYWPSALNGGTWAHFGYDEIHSFPLQLEARWTSPTEVAGYGATPISSVDEFQSILENPSGTYSLECNLSLGDYDWDWPMGDFTGILYGNGLTITLNELSGPLFDTVSGEISNLNISGTLNTAGFAYDTKSMLCNLNTGYICNCKYRLKDTVPVADSLLGTGTPDCFDYCGYERWDPEEGWVEYNGDGLPPLFIEETPPAPSFPDTGYDATDFTQTKFYQISDVQWNAPLESSKPLGLTVTGGMYIDYTCTGTEFLKLQNIQESSSITADIYLYTSEDDTEGTLKGTYTIDAVTKYGIKTGTPFLFTGEGLNQYNSRTENDASGKRMDSEMIICNPTNIDDIQTAIVQYLGDGQQGGNTLGITMVNVPGGTVNVSTASVDSVFYSASSDPITVNAFQIAETEVTYAQWCEVYDWATSNERGDNKYSFAQTGQPGNNGEGQSLSDANGSQPATNMSWRDVIAWCNAASEYEGLDPVYYYFENGTGDFSSSNVIREAEISSDKSAGQGKADNITVNPNANGYRLPTEAEWEYAARGGNPDADAWNYSYAGSDTCSDVAKRDYSTTFVKSLTANSLGLYDMCGNAGEFVWKKNSSDQNRRYYRGGSCNSPYESYCTITSYSYVDYQTSRNTDLGFRVVTGGAGNFGNL